MIISGGVVTCKCGNAARYMNERGELCCAICPLKEGVDSIKLDDVPKLLAWARAWGKRQPDYTLPEHFREQAKEALKELRDIIQCKALPPPSPEPTPEEKVRQEHERAQRNAALLREAVKCCCHRPGWLGPHHDDPKCEFREGRA